MWMYTRIWGVFVFNLFIFLELTILKNEGDFHQQTLLYLCIKLIPHSLGFFHLLTCIFSVFPDHSGAGAAKPESSTASASASNGQPVSSQNGSSLSLLGAYTDSDDSNSD